MVHPAPRINSCESRLAHSNSKCNTRPTPGVFCFTVKIQVFAHNRDASLVDRCAWIWQWHREMALVRECVHLPVSVRGFDNSECFTGTLNEHKQLVFVFGWFHVIISYFQSARRLLQMTNHGSLNQPSTLNCTQEQSAFAVEQEFLNQNRRTANPHVLLDGNIM